MSEDGKQLSILVVGVRQETVARLTSELGIKDYKACIPTSQAGAIEALRGQTHYVEIVTAYSDPVTGELELLLNTCPLGHRKSTPIRMASEAG